MKQSFLMLTTSSLFYFGCTASSPPPSVPEPTRDSVGEVDAPAESVEPKLEALLNGKQAEMKFASLTQEPGSALLLRIANHDFGCSQNRSAAPDNEVMVSLTLAPVLQPSGNRIWKVVHTSFDSSTYQGDAGEVVVEGDSAQGALIKLPSLHLKGAGQDARTLQLAGDIRAKGCGQPESSHSISPAPQKNFSWSIAGQPFLIQGALLERSVEEDRILLSTSPADCEQQEWVADAKLDISLRKGSTPSTFLRGSVFPSQMSGGFSSTETPPNIVIGTPKDGRVEITLEGTYDQTGYPVEFKGILNVPVCKR